MSSPVTLPLGHTKLLNVSMLKVQRTATTSDDPVSMGVRVRGGMESPKLPFSSDESSSGVIKVQQA